MIARILLSSIVALACAAGSPGALPAPAAGSVWVYADSALFLFPAQARTTWVWNDPSVPPVEHYWWAAIGGDSAAYRVGFQIPRSPAAAAPDSGSLDRLLVRARPEVYEQLGGPFVREVPGARSAVEARGGRPVMVVRGADLVRRLFRAYPARITFWYASYGRPLRADTAAVEYR